MGTLHWIDLVNGHSINISVQLRNLLRGLFCFSFSSGGFFYCISPQCAPRSQMRTACPLPFSPSQQFSFYLLSHFPLSLYPSPGHCQFPHAGSSSAREGGSLLYCTDKPGELGKACVLYVCLSTQDASRPPTERICTHCVDCRPVTCSGC